MSTMEEKRSLTIYSACMRGDGLATFARNQVEVTEEEAENGIQFYLVEAQLLEAGLEEPFVHFPEEELPTFVVAALAQQVATSMTEPCLLTENPSENR